MTRNYILVSFICECWSHLNHIFCRAVLVRRSSAALFKVNKSEASEECDLCSSMKFGRRVRRESDLLNLYEKIKIV